MHFSIFMSLSITTNTTPLSAVRFFGYVGFGNFWFFAIIRRHIFDFDVILHTVSLDGRIIFTQRTANMLGCSNIVKDRGW